MFVNVDSEYVAHHWAGTQASPTLTNAPSLLALWLPMINIEGSLYSKIKELVTINLFGRNLSLVP